MEDVSRPTLTDLHAFVVQKLTRVFGGRRADELLQQQLRALHLERVSTIEDLVHVAESLQARGGFEATMGAMLGVQAQMLRLGRS